MTGQLVCWKCGAELKQVILPLSRREECLCCNADQHVCKMCSHYDRKVAGACKEDCAEDVMDKERANFCDYFQLNRQSVGRPCNSAAVNTRQALADLFGDKLTDSELADPLTEASEHSTANLSGSDLALSELERLFNKD